MGRRVRRRRRVGLAAAAEWERLGLASLYIKEVRKGAFLPPVGKDDDYVRRAFLLHVQAAFVESEDVKEVLDFQPRLLASARQMASRPDPIEAVILYATWMEHWLNAVLLTTMLRRNMSEEDSLQLIRQANVDAKLGALWRLVQLPALPETYVKRLRFLTEVRNEHVHYKWKGQDPDVLFGPSARLSLAIAEIDQTAQDLVHFEIDVLLKDEVAAAGRLFNIDLRQPLTRAALEWKEPAASTLAGDA